MAFWHRHRLFDHPALLCLCGRPDHSKAQQHPISACERPGSVEGHQTDPHSDQPQRSQTNGPASSGKADWRSPGGRASGICQALEQRSVSRYYALFENSIDAFYNLLDSYIIREGWRVDFLDTRDNSFPWSVFLDSSGKLLCCQNNPTHPDKPGAITEAEARLTAQSYLTPTVYGSIPSFHESSAVPLPDQHQWLFSFSDSLDHELVSGRVQLQLVIGAGGVTSFQPGISMPPDHAAAIAAAEQLTRRMKIGALVVILLFMIRLFVFTLGRFRRVNGTAAPSGGLCCSCFP